MSEKCHKMSQQGIDTRLATMQYAESMNMKLLNLLAAATLSCTMMMGSASATIAYSDSNTTLGLNQNYGNSLGMDFDVISPILITSLGAYNTGLAAELDGLNGSGVTVGIYDRNTHLIVGPSVLFTSSSSVTQIGADAFISVTPFLLPTGFQGSIVAWNDKNYNSQGGANIYSTTDDGGGAITFGTTRYDNGFVYPTITPFLPENRFSSATFEFTVVPETSTIIAGALLLLPFGASTIRILRKNRTA